MGNNKQQTQYYDSTRIRFIIRYGMDVARSNACVFMQPGFALCEAGFTRSKNTANILFKNFVDFMFGSLLFWFVGFGFMFGSGGEGFIGMPNFGDLSFTKVICLLKVF